MHYSLFIPVTPITFEIIDKWCWWYFCQKMFFYFFSIFRLQSVLFQSGNTILFHRHLKDGEEEEERRKTKNIWTENTLWYWEFIFAVLLNPFQNAIYQCNQYLRVNGYVMTDDLKTCVFPANKKKTLRSLQRHKVWQRFAGWCDDYYIYAFAIYGEETICSTHLHTALQGMILYAFLALIHTAI